MATFSGVPASADALLAPFFGVEAPDVWQACRQSWREVLSLAREGRTPAWLALGSALEIIERSLAEELAQRDALDAPALVKRYLQTYLADRPYEAFVVMYLDAQNRLIVTDVAFRGTVTATAIYPREIARRALSTDAVGILMAHNHPSGIAAQSPADERLTNALKSALALIDVRVLDHIIVAGRETLSFAESGLL